MQNKHDIATLNSLIATTLDSADGYAEAADEARSPSLTALFRDRADERRQVASILQQRVRLLGGEAERDGTTLAAAHRMFVNLRTSLTSNDNKVVVEEVERGEDHIKHKFEDAMKDEDMSPDTLSVVADAYTSVRNGHDQMRDIQRAFRD